MALVAAVVLGIIGMHGIGLHGSQHADPGGLAAHSVVSETPPMTGHDTTPAPHDHAHSQSQGTATRQGGVVAMASPLALGHGMTGMAMFCIAMLVGAALAWTLLRSQRSTSVLFRERLITSVRVARRADARQTGPPMVWAFSVVRC